MHRTPQRYFTSGFLASMYVLLAAEDSVHGSIMDAINKVLNCIIVWSLVAGERGECELDWDLRCIWAGTFSVPFFFDCQYSAEKERETNFNSIYAAFMSISVVRIIYNTVYYFLRKHLIISTHIEHKN